MPVKRLYVLANSRKKQGHCIAGMEIIEDEDGDAVFGDWIRPVSRHGEGELTYSDCRFPDGKTPNIFDVVDIDLEGNEGSKSQPENWFINPKACWKKVTADPDDIPKLDFDTPSKLWMAPDGRDDRISPDDLEKLKSRTSLYLIEVTNFRFHLSWKSWDGKASQRCRAMFDYRGKQYDFSMTDPVAREKYCSPFPKQDDGAKTVRLASGKDCILCVSITPSFNGYHYKIAATVIEDSL